MNEIFETSIFEKGDAAYAVVTSRNNKGVYLELDGGELAFSYTAANVPINGKVIVSVVRPSDGTKRTLVKLDSVCDFRGYEAA